MLIVETLGDSLIESINTLAKTCTNRSLWLCFIILPHFQISLCMLMAA